jgi:replication factor A1
MEIKDLQARQGNVDLMLKIVDKGDVREFEKFGKKGRVCNATAKDETGTIKLTLWNEQIDEIDVGDKVHITNGYVGEYQGELQLSTGKFGQLEVVEKAEKKPEAPPEKPSGEELPEDLQPEEEDIENNN